MCVAMSFSPSVFCVCDFRQLRHTGLCQPHRVKGIAFILVLCFLLLHSLLDRAGIPFNLFSQGTKEKEVLMAPQDFQGKGDNMVEMDMLEKKGIQDPQYV